MKRLLFAILLLPWTTAWAFTTNSPSYMTPLLPSVTLRPLLTVGDSVPRTSNLAQSFRLIGVPDGLGLSVDADGRHALWVNHELKKNDVSQPVAGEPLANGAFVSRLLFSKEGEIVSGDLAATTYFLNGQIWKGPAALFCSGFAAGSEAGFDRSFYFAGEEASGDQTADGKGGLAFAFTGGNAYALPQFGRYRKENVVAVPGSGLKTLVFGLEDGPKGLQSELYLYIGNKDLSSSDPLARNGLTGGKLYAFASTTGGRGDESKFRKTDPPIRGKWVPIDRPEDLTDVQLDAKAAESGAFRFDRIEDGTYDRNQNGVFYFVTTGGSIAENRRGRLYRLTFNPKDPLGGTMLLEILLEGDVGDGIASPDNIDMNAAGEMIILEDFTTGSFFEAFKRNPSVWLYRPASSEMPVRIAEVQSKFWESSGVIDASSLFGRGSWILDVQAHTIGSAEASKRQGLEGDAQLVEGGQILLMRTQ